eukprot:g7876.t1
MFSSKSIQSHFHPSSLPNKQQRSSSSGLIVRKRSSVEKSRCRVNLRREMWIKATWLEPLVTVAVPTLFTSFFCWSLIRIQKLKSKINQLQNSNEASNQLQEDSSTSLETYQASISAPKTTTIQGFKTVTIGSKETDEQVANLKEELDRINKDWLRDQDRVRILERAREAAVKDVSDALASRREAEIQTKQTSEKLQALKENLNVKNMRLKEMEDLLEEQKQQINELQKQKDDLEIKLAKSNNQNASSVKLDTIEKDINQESYNELRDLQRQLKQARDDASLARDYAKSELKLMTLDLVRVRDQKNQLALQTENLTIELSEAEKKIKDLENQLEQSFSNSTRSPLASGDDTESMSFSQSYLYEMRAEAALMVEEIEDKAYLDLEHAMKRSQMAEKTALKGLMMAAKEKEKAAKLQKTLDSARVEIDDKQKEIWYLKDLLRALFSDREQLAIRTSKPANTNES